MFKSSAIAKVSSLIGWLEKQGHNEEALSLEREQDSYLLPDKLPQDFRVWLRRRLVANQDPIIDPRLSIKNQMIRVAIVLRSNPHRFTRHYFEWKEEALKNINKPLGSVVETAPSEKVRQLRLF
jgi:hypothetical protein